MTATPADRPVITVEVGGERNISGGAPSFYLRRRRILLGKMTQVPVDERQTARSDLPSPS
jgi:hypothetical protein